MTSENLDNTPDNLFVSQTHKFKDEYKDACFYAWYNAGKPTVKDLLEIIPFPDTNYGAKPTQTTLHTWIYDYFVPRATELDAGVHETMNRALIVSKVEMLERQAKIGRQMQDMALEYLETHKDDLTANASVRLLVEGLRVEFERSGIPDALLKMADMSDQELQEELAKLIEDSPLEMEDDNE